MSHREERRMSRDERNKVGRGARTAAFELKAEGGSHARDLCERSGISVIEPTEAGVLNPSHHEKQ